MKQTLYNTLLKTLRFFTRMYLWRTKPIVIGITGSVGKTSCRMIIAQVLRQVLETQHFASLQKQIYTSPKNYNSELGLVFSIFQIESYEPSIKNLLKLSWDIFKKSLFQKKQYDILVAEYGIDSPRDMDFLLSVMQPDYGVLTKLDSVHSENFPGGVEQYWKEKLKLLLASKQGTYFNAQDEFAQVQEELYRSPKKLFSAVQKSSLSFENNTLRHSFSYQKKNISINLIGNESREYTLLALKLAEDIGFQLSEKEYSFHFEVLGGRFSLFQKEQNLLIDSTYNASPESMKLAIYNTQKIQKEMFPDARNIYVLGDMRELGAISAEAHRSLASEILDGAAIFTVGPHMYEYLVPALKEQGFSGNITSSLSSREIGEKLKKYLHNHSEKKYIILFKGSQNTIFTEEALAAQLTPTQQKNLPRQTEDWKRKKDEFFKSL